MRIKVLWWRVRYFYIDLADYLERIAAWLDPEIATERERIDEQLKTLAKIARGEIKPADARMAAYAALY